MATKSIGLSEVTADDLGREATKHKVSRDKVISKMLDFFRIYGIDPFNYDAPADEMQKILKRVDYLVSFMKKQEKDTLIPTLTRLASNESVLKIEQKTGLLITEMSKALESLKSELHTLRKENHLLKTELLEQLSKDKKALSGEHQQIANVVVRQVSKMLQITLDKDGGIGKKDTRNERLGEYER